MVAVDAAELAHVDLGVSLHRALNRKIPLLGASWTVNLDLELPKAEGDVPVVEAAAAVAADGDDVVDHVAADADHHEMVDVDTSDPVERGDPGDQTERGDAAVSVAGVSVGVAAVGAAAESSLERAGPTHLLRKVHVHVCI